MPSWVADYTCMKGHIDLRKATAAMMESTWIKKTVDPECLAF